ncbi:uncharacterized protein LOC114125060 [Aphis gossypii]|uniref:uncharacterized protein LOC114125060 n=1 Tax=Aphis gossypii TaxID=80765 RepID=UPI00100D9E56|nr:uncharacterized protein LOC114125060 [Aphis gossypii]
MEFIVRILILVGITFSSWVETLNNEAINTIDLSDQMRLSGLYCPSMTLKKKYKLIMIYQGVELYGCASMNHNRYLSDSPLIHFWLQLPPNPNAEPTYCQNTCNMFPYIYECMSKSEPTNKNEIDKGLKYMSLYQYSPKYKQANTSAIPAYTCVVFVTEKYKDHGIMTIRMAVSPGRANSFDVKQCEGLSNVLTNKGDIYDHETQKKWPKGATYIFIMGDLEPDK